MQSTYWCVRSCALVAPSPPCRRPMPSTVARFALLLACITGAATLGHAQEGPVTDGSGDEIAPAVDLAPPPPDARGEEPAPDGDAAPGDPAATDPAASEPSAEPIGAPDGGEAPASGRSAVRVDTVRVTSTPGPERQWRDTFQPTTVLTGEALQRAQGASVPETLQHTPGFALQYNGPGASGPIVRGLAGDRVLMLEDGFRTGDIYWTAADHGVMVEPISARSIEVVRGPAGLLFGPNALGGVVNVVRDEIPRERVEHVDARAAGSYDSVNHGVAGGAVVRAPVGPLTLYAEASGRETQNTRTPAGELPDSAISSFGGAAGLAWIGNRTEAGASVRYYANDYGVPGEFNGQLLPGGHPGGVRIEVDRLAIRARAAWAADGDGIRRIELRSGYTIFGQREIEAVLAGRPILGAAYDQETSDTRLTLQHGNAGIADGLEGTLGFSVGTRRLSAGGFSPGTRSGGETDVAAFVFEELRTGAFRWQAAGRFDARFVASDDRSEIRVRTTDRTIVKPVDDRFIPTGSGSVGSLWDITPTWTLGTTASLTSRAPTLEELFSDGPHLASFSFDIGSPDLRAERAYGLDLFVRSERPGLSVEVAGWVNRIDDFIYALPTTESVPVIREGGALRMTPVFESRGADALFVGAEGRVEWTFVPAWTVEAVASWTQAQRRFDNDPLPFIPPFAGRVDLRWEGLYALASLGGTFSAAQTRVPRPVAANGQFERPQQPTDAWALLHASAGWRFERDRYDHLLLLRVENALDTEWRSHLSRIKDVAPNPGRSVMLIWQGYFSGGPT